MYTFYREAGSRPLPAQIAWVTTKPAQRDPAVVSALTAGSGRSFYNGQSAAAVSARNEGRDTQAVARPVKDRSEPRVSSRQAERYRSESSAPAYDAGADEENDEDEDDEDDE